MAKHVLQIALSELKSVRVTTAHDNATREVPIKDLEREKVTGSWFMATGNANQKIVTQQLAKLGEAISTLLEHSEHATVEFVIPISGDSPWRVEKSAGSK